MLEWLKTYDPKPSVVPRWANNSLFAVVVLWEPTPGECAAYVILDEATFRAVSLPGLCLPGAIDSRKLFFEIPRESLISSGFCEGLTKASFYQQEK